MRPFSHLLPSAFFCSVIGFSACGGNVSDGGEQGGKPGQGGAGTGGPAVTGGVGTAPATGGVIGTGGAIGQGGALSTGGAAPTTGGCCAKLVLCPAGEKQVSNNASCPTGSECYVIDECCQRVTCARPLVTCTAIPTCDPTDRQLTGACPPALSCYTRTLCGSTIHCVSESGAGGSSGAGTGGSVGQAGAASAGCDPTTEYNRKYVTTNPASCALIDFGCPAATTRAFFNGCGCGCEQPSTCPRFVDCMPGPSPTNPLCSSSDCPYTLRAL